MALPNHASLALQPIVDLGIRLTNVSSSQVQLDDSGVFSDDTGFFSSPEDVGNSLLRAESPLHLPRSAQTISKRTYDELLKKYLGMKVGPSSFGPTHAIDFDELIEVLKMSATFSGLSITAQVLELALTVWSNSVMDCLRCAKSLAADCTRGEKSRRHQSESSSALEEVGASRTNNLPVIENECDRDWADHRRTIPRNLQSRKSLVVDDNHISSTTFTECVPDVVQRRKLLSTKFHGLANETLLDCEFNIHDVYQSEVSSICRSTLSPGSSVSDIMVWIYRHSEGAQNMFLPIFIPLYHSQDSEDDEMFDEMTSTQEEQLTQENTEPPDSFLEMENMDPIQDQPSSENIDQILTLSGEQKQILQNAASKTNQLKFQRRKRSARAPLEPLNTRYAVSNVQNGEVLAIEAKRMMLDDSGICQNDFSSDNVDPDLDCGQQDEGYCSQFLSTSQDEALNPNASISEFNIPPLFSDREDNDFFVKTSVRHKPVDMKDLINKFDRVLLCETNDRQPKESSFVEIVRKSKISISATSSTFEDTNSGDASVSVGLAFLACLHVAHTNRLYLVETEDTIFNITTSLPEDSSFS